MYSIVQAYMYTHLVILYNNRQYNPSMTAQTLTHDSFSATLQLTKQEIKPFRMSDSKKNSIIDKIDNIIQSSDKSTQVLPIIYNQSGKRKPL